MAPTLREPVSFAKAVVGVISEKHITFMAGSIAYQAFVSLVPLLVLVFFLVSAVGDEQLAAEVTAMTEGVLPESGQELLESAIEGSIATTGASVIGLVTLVWGSLKVFRGLDTAFSEIYESMAESSFVDSLKDGLVVLGAIVTALLAVGVATAVFAILPESTLVGLLNPIVLAVGLTVAFFPLYYVFPDVEVTAREVLPGVVVAAVGWAALQSLFQVYVAASGGSSAGEAFGAVILLLTWLYFGALVLLIAGVVNAVSADRIELEELGTEERGAESDTPPTAVGPGEFETLRRERDRLGDRVERLALERDQFRNDLDAQRMRRYRLEDRTDELEATVRELEGENARLRREVEQRRDPEWKRSLRRVLRSVTRLRVGVVERLGR